jgi:hypothetical protein
MTLLLFIGYALAEDAGSGPPLIGDDPGTPGPGNWEINLAATASRTATVTELNAPQLDLNYGVGDRIQIAYSVAYGLDMTNGKTSGGLGDSVFGVKWRFYDNEDAHLSASIYPKIMLPRNLGNQVVNNIELPAEISWTTGKWTLGVDGGYELGIAGKSSGDAENGWFAGAAGGLAVSDPFQLLAEVHAEGAGTSTELVFNLGARYAATPWLNLLVSGGHSLVTHNADPELFGYFAFQFVTG